jgi:hypothetical protein
MDFYQVKDRVTKHGVEVYPDFVVRRSEDLMVRGGSFYAVWDEGAGLWSTDEFDVQRLIDADLYKRAEELKDPDIKIHVQALGSYKSNMWKEFRSYTGNIPDSSHRLDTTLAFANTPPCKTLYSSKRLSYSVGEGPIEAYDRLMSVLYAPEERRKLEWGIGAIVSGDSRYIHKFFVLYGEAGTGKSTFLNIVQQLFKGYDAAFDAKAVTSANNAFATEAFRGNPLVAIQHDGDLSKIEDNTRLNSIVSHEDVIINEKYKSTYTSQINALLFIGSNQSVRITDAKSGLIRRLIDVHPTGEKIPEEEYARVVSQVGFELGAIAHHCYQIYMRLGKNYYSSYRPVDMILRSDIFYNFLLSQFDLFKEQDGTSLIQAWTLYKEFCEESGYEWKMNRSKFRDELRNYFDAFDERIRVNGALVRSWFSGFKTDKLGANLEVIRGDSPLVIDLESSLLDVMLADYPAQYANEDETPGKKWANVKTTLSDLDTSRIHYVKPGEQHVVIDFDLKGDDGEKSLERNLEAASLWPSTYAELSKGGAGIHLHYVYDGDISKLSRVYGPGIEVKVFNGDSSLRRRLTKCNDIPVALITGGLPIKEEKMIDSETIKTEKGLRNLILRNLRKEIHPGTKPSIDFIWKILEDAYNSDLPYDVTDLRGRVLAFANNSSNQSHYCVKVVLAMKFASETAAKPAVAEPADDRLVLYDVEVFPNLFVVCWKYRGDSNIVRMINPSSQTIEEFCNYKLVGFYNRRYDNHILYARIMGYDNLSLFKLSQRLVNNEKNAMFGDAYNISYADIWDFSSLKQSLKRFQIDLGLNHQELGLPWDEPVDPAMWEEVVDYCANDVITTEQVFEARMQDFIARQILANMAGMTVNDTTQKLTAKIIFGDDRRPQEKFVYTDLSTIFPGYKYDFGKSSYKGEDPGEGGYVYAEPGMYSEVAELDVASMHPTSIELLNVFGPYTGNFAALKAARIAIKRRDYSAAKTMLGGALAPYLGSDEDAAALAYALKIVINIVYGLTSASFDNPFRDPRNKDNIVAKRGALFMIDLKEAVQAQGFKVIHIKTDSIKIPDATPEIIKFVQDFGEKYGYDFEHEATYKKFCLVNDAVYIAKKQDGTWTATGAQFQHPYVFKTLFSKEPLVFSDFVETKTVTAALYLQFDEMEPQFIGRAGAFVPVLAGCGGGILLRGKDGVFHSASGAKGHLWKEATRVQKLGQDDQIDMSYFTKLVDSAVKNISNYGDFEWFTS